MPRAGCCLFDGLPALHRILGRTAGASRRMTGRVAAGAGSRLTGGAGSAAGSFGFSVVLLAAGAPPPASAGSIAWAAEGAASPPRVAVSAAVTCRVRSAIKKSFPRGSGGGETRIGRMGTSNVGDMADLKLSVLDQSPISEGSTGSRALHQTIELARLADRLGYHRYWVAEHHGGPMLAGPSPEVLIGPIASATERIRVGSGGVMLPHYSPFKVAESFSLLAGLYPERIDLALGRASGTDPMTAHALQRDRTNPMPDDFPNQLAELLAYLEDRLPAEPPVRAAGQGAARPAREARAVAAGLLAAERGLGRRAGPALRLRRLHQPRRRADRRALPRQVRGLRAAGRAAAGHRGVGAGGRHRGGGAASWRRPR